MKQLAHHMGASNLLFFVAMLISAAFFAIGWLSTLCRVELDAFRAAALQPKANSPVKIAELSASVLASRHLQTIAAIVALTFFVSTVVDYQFKIAVGDAFDTSAKRAEYFGYFFSITGVLSAFVQFGFTSRLLERFGVLVSLILLSLLMFGGSVWMLLVPSLLAASWLKGSENVLRYTVNDAAMQLLYVPVQASSAPVRSPSSTAF